MWSIAYEHYTNEGRKVTYRCNKVKARGAQCPAGLLLLYHSERNAVTLYRVNIAHEHDGRVSTRGLAPAIRTAVEELYRDGKMSVKPSSFSMRYYRFLICRCTETECDFDGAGQKITAQTTTSSIGQFPTSIQEKSARPAGYDDS